MVLEEIWGDLSQAHRSLTIVVLSEGYLAGEANAFRDDAWAFAKHFKRKRPFSGYLGLINIVSLFVDSPTSAEGSVTNKTEACAWRSTPGASPPPTRFKARYCQDVDANRNGIARSLFGDAVEVRRAIDAEPRLKGRDWLALVIVNNTKFDGGTGGNPAWTAKDPTPSRLSVAKDPTRLGVAKHPRWLDVAVHELGHVLGLADEYDNDAQATSNFWGAEPVAEPNVTAFSHPPDLATFWSHAGSNPSLSRFLSVAKPSLGAWSRMLHPTAAAVVGPTVLNSGCTPLAGDAADPVIHPGVPLGTVGLFEGASHYPCNLYRPTYTCTMRHSYEDFCPVCYWHLEGKLQRYFLTPTVQSFPTPRPVGVWSEMVPYLDPDPTTKAHLRAGLLFYSASGSYVTLESHNLAFLPLVPPIAVPQPLDAGWSSLIPLEASGAQNFLVYNRQSGRRAIYRLESAGGVRHLVLAWDSGPAPVWSWSHVAVFTSSGLPHAIWYRKRTGEVAIDRFDVLGAPPTLVWGTALDSTARWLPDWTLVTTLRMNGTPHVLLYNGATGASTLQSLDPVGTGPNVWISTPRDSWQSGFTALLPFTIGGHTYVARTSPLSLLAVVDRLRTSGGSDPVTSFPVLPGSTALAFTEPAQPSPAQGTSHIVASYNPLAGVNLFGFADA